MNRLQALRDAGVSIWLDTLSRELLDSGDFAGLIADCAVTGATSNPTIFAKAITGSDRYDEQLRAAGSEARDPQELFFELALEDIRRAADLLRPSYDDSGGRDGFVSFECTPDLADDTQATIAQALELWRRLDRPNVMIKVPATEAGIPAIEELTARGVNVNITLLFSLARYEQVIDAYLIGLERRLAGGEPIDTIASVASFFVSRVDAKTDPLLPAGSPLRGRLAIANARRGLRALPRPLRRRALALATRRRRSSSATAVGQHRDQGPQLLRRALRRGADRPGCRSTPCPKPRCVPSPTTARWATPLSVVVGAAEADSSPCTGGGHRPRRHHRTARARGRALLLRLLSTSCSPASRPSSNRPAPVRSGRRLRNRGLWSVTELPKWSRGAGSDCRKPASTPPSRSSCRTRAAWIFTP